MRLLKYQNLKLLELSASSENPSSNPDFDVNVKIQLLIGRDVIEAHHILEQITGYRGQPFAQRPCLGWAIIEKFVSAGFTEDLQSLYSQQWKCNV